MPRDAAKRREAVMPREVIYDQANMYDVHVGWSKESGYLQVGVESHDRVPIARRLYEGQDDTDSGAADEVATAASAEFTGLWGTLDRAGANRLIRALRKARDEAFGRDE